VSDVSSKIFAYDNIPAAIKFLVELSFYNSCNFTVFLSFKNISEISNLFNGSIRNTDNSTLFLCTSIREFYQNLLKIVSLLLPLIFLPIFIILCVINLILLLQISRIQGPFILLLKLKILAVKLRHFLFDSIKI